MRSVTSWFRSHHWATDLLLAVFVFAISYPLRPPDASGATGPPSPTGWGLVFLAAAAGALVFRRQRPVAVLAATLLLGGAATAADGSFPRAMPAIAVALYTVGAYTSRRVTITAAIITAVIPLLGLAAAGNPTGWSDPASYAVVFLAGMAAALGDAVRSNRAVLADAVERASRAERNREAEAQRRVTEERLRIARELHDAVAHHIAVVNVQAGVAEHLLSSDPATATDALTKVRLASREALSEMHQMVGLLRTPEDRPGLAPAPGLADLPALIAGAREAGVGVDFASIGSGTLSPAVDGHAYRIVQEALTNAAKHGSGRVRINVTRGPDAVRIQVSNPTQPRPSGDVANGA
ncbi:MAG: sensor histidine kinase, partial [Candidatus Nanopelagicales bacterium]